MSSFRQFADIMFAGVSWFVKTLIASGTAIFIVASGFARTILAEPTGNRGSKHEQNVEERRVLVTGSLIPQRIKLQPIGTKTVSPIRFIDRHEIDRSERPTTPGALFNDPSVRIIGR